MSSEGTGHSKFPRLNHIAIAVKDQSKLLRVFEILGLRNTGSELVPEQGVQTYFLQGSVTADSPQIEILEPVDEAGVIAKYLEKRGAGIHHLCIEVASCEDACEVLKQHGLRLIYAAARNGAHGMRINFIHPESTGGILVEVSSAGKNTPEASH